MTVQQAAEFLKQHDHFLILTHCRPDGDTIGCAAGLCRALRHLGKIAYVLENCEVTPLFAPYLDGLVAPCDFQPETVLAVDIATITLLPENSSHLQGRIDLAIDHHPSQDFFAKNTCLDASCAACGEIVYAIVTELGALTADIGTPLYVAISTDCGCFVYANTTANTHHVAAQLMDLGINAAALNKRHFRTKSMRRMQLESALIASMELYEDNAVALVMLTQTLIHKIGVTQQDTEDIAALAGQLEGVKVSITLRETDDGFCKLSLRTDAAYLNANHVCALLGGGGHAAAAGAIVKGTVAQTKEKILAAIREIKLQ